MIFKIPGDPLNGRPIKGLMTREPEFYEKFIKEHRVKEQFKDCHKGERCFILGNGPSVAESDLSLLADEFVFTVNFASKLEQYKEVKSNYHLMNDMRCFGERHFDDSDIIKQNHLKYLNNIRTHDCNPICFFNYYAYDFVKKNKLDDMLDINYCLTNRNLNGEKIMYHNILLYAIDLAMYMGFSEIYLLGCEWSIYINVLEAKLNKDIDQTKSLNLKLLNNDKLHGYNEEFEEKHELLKALQGGYTTSAWLKSAAKCIDDIETLKHIQEERGGKLINCTPQTIIDCLPRKKLEDVLKQPVK